jgi:CheY-like chemotaxis protein
MAREILVADPNKAAHKAFEEIFRETDYNLIFSENGEDALLKMKLFKPALVIADVTMPDKSGKELCQMLKGDPNLNKVPFVLLGGPFDEDIEEDKKQVRADGAITKPLKREPILQLVDGLLTVEPVEGTREVEEEILELQPVEEVTEAVSSRGEEEIFDLVDIIEEPAAKPEEAPIEAPGEALVSGETRESEEGGFLGEEVLVGLELPEGKGYPKGEEAIQASEMERLDQGSEVSGKVDFEEEPAKMADRVSPEEEIAEFGGIEEQYPGSLQEAAEAEVGEFGAVEITEELPTEGVGEVPQDVLKEKGLEEALGEEIEELPVEEAAEAEVGEFGVEEITEELPTEGVGEVPQDVLKEKGLEEALAEEIEELPVEEAAEAEVGEFGVEEIMEELPTEGVGEVPQDVLKEKGLEEALAEEIEELPADLLGEKDTPDEGKRELERLEELGEETEVLGEEEEVLKEALRELPGEAVEEGGLEELPGEQLATEELEGPPQEVSQEIDLEGLAQKVLKEEDSQVFGEGGLKEEGLEEFYEEVFKEGELEKIAEEATRDQEREEIPEGALAEAIEEFTGETVRVEEEMGVSPSQEKPIQKTISGAIKELVEGVSAKIVPQLIEAIAAAATEKIEKTVQKIVPEMAEKAIQKEIRRLENLKKGEDFDV